MAEEDTLTEVLYDIDRMAETSALLDHEVQRFVVLLRSAPNDEARALILKACGPELPRFLEMAEEFRKTGISFLHLNEAISRLLEEGIGSDFRSVQDRPTNEGSKPLTPQQIDPVFAEGLRQLKEAQKD